MWKFQSHSSFSQTTSKDAFSRRPTNQLPVLHSVLYLVPQGLWEFSLVLFWRRVERTGPVFLQTAPAFAFAWPLSHSGLKLTRYPGLLSAGEHIGKLSGFGLSISGYRFTLLMSGIADDKGFLPRSWISPGQWCYDAFPSYPPFFLSWTR